MRFEPDGDRAVAIDARMHLELAKSLSVIGDAACRQWQLSASPMMDLVERIRQGSRVAPNVFGCYYDLVRAIRDGERQRAEALIAQLEDAPTAPSGLVVSILGTTDLAEESERYLRLLSDGDPAGSSIRAPDAATAALFEEKLAAGLALLDTALPALAGEIRGLVRQVVLIGSDPKARVQVDGGSHYQLWGGLFLNVAFHNDVVAVAEVLAHETAHSLLFGLCIDEPLVRNGADTLYPSPLRQDRRPMDGIFHATFVAARMYWAMARLADDAQLTAPQRQRAARAARQDAAHFRAGHETVLRHGILTETGREIIDAAAGYMRAA